MKKDKEWLKKEIATEMIELEPNRKERWSDVRYQTLRNVAQKIDQLDESKVLSQEWIDNNVVHVRGLGDIFEAVAVESILVPKQELPVIPQFVADWWERDDDAVTMYGRLRVEKKHKFDLISIFYDKGLGDYLSKVEDWIYENNSAFLDLVNGKPYEVEKEKLYYVYLHDGNCLVSDDNKDFTKASTYFMHEESSGFLNRHLFFTEEQIKQIDENYWPFAVEVSE